jgi:hypothetical protein
VRDNQQRADVPTGAQGWPLEPGGRARPALQLPRAPWVGGHRGPEQGRGVLYACRTSVDYAAFAKDELCVPQC